MQHAPTIRIPLHTNVCGELKAAGIREIRDDGSTSITIENARRSSENIIRSYYTSASNDSDEEGTEKGGGSDEDGNHEETAEDGNDGSSGSMDDSDDVMFDDLVQSYGWSKAEANGFKKLIESLEDDANAEEVLKHN
ncbi:hypothetical protein QR680_011802 [Steinernema hermaphroditum]|uniref:Uncharacterized protein n=1 Tax=Steinernema hermaphroditum TaxID=289476 RepID=A0AA39I2A6_9BILA|nr:hypothetical protein QR680_011802 [Steinernema hermaphroditum]